MLQNQQGFIQFGGGEDSGGSPPPQEFDFKHQNFITSHQIKPLAFLSKITQNNLRLEELKGSPKSMFRGTWHATHLLRFHPKFLSLDETLSSRVEIFQMPFFSQLMST